MAGSIPEGLHPARISSLLGNTRFGRTLILCDSVASTNSALAVVSPGLPEGTVLLTGSQTAGRGRKGRSWYSSESGSLVFSILARPSGDPSTLTQLLALCAAESIERECEDVAVDIKWPNDLFAGGRKLAGILAESAGGEVVLGMGIDVNDDPAGFPEDIAGTAVSLRAVTGARHDRGRLLAGILTLFEEYYARWLDGGLAPFRFDMKERLMWIGREVVLDHGSGKIAGVFEGLSPEGSLLLGVEGAVRPFSSGDLSLSVRGAEDE